MVYFTSSVSKGSWSSDISAFVEPRRCRMVVEQAVRLTKTANRRRVVKVVFIGVEENLGEEH